MKTIDGTRLVMLKAAIVAPVANGRKDR
jgi:hypothetical protein